MTETPYPESLKSVLEANPFENILDSNIFSAYIRSELHVPPIDDPRKTQIHDGALRRHPGYVKSSQINQVFTYIGFIKRTDNRQYREYLPTLFQELNRFLRTLETIIFELDVSVSQEIYEEQKNGLENFLTSYDGQPHDQIGWIEKICKHQKIYLENIDALLDTLQLRGRVFDFSDDPLYGKIVGFLKHRFSPEREEQPSANDFRFVANTCVKAVKDGGPKTIWSGDIHIIRILEALYGDASSLSKVLPEIYLRASYTPRHYQQLFP
jgi:hypothetical protein